MVDLPSGTVTLLFSDVEGSTVLLSRLGPAYATALDGQRQVLREAWVGHGGTELGTEGDSFFVVFATAQDAVAAATQAQRRLAGFDWPGGERVRVRMGIHTGSPAVHDGGYVGMDVHRAARIAGAAHGGQVAVSSATAELVAGFLPVGVELRDLGSHQLKDIANPEHLFQLTIEGLQTGFAPLKTLGAASSLPRPATPLVGRDGELAELTGLLSSPEVRLVTLTGPGGSGKTRLAIGVAQSLVNRFPDGVYFVPLAAVTTEDVMWSSIAEVLDVPPEARTPPGLFTHVAHRSALFVLDNLEQVDAADDVVAQLLDAARQVVVIATSRSPLNVPGEFRHSVPPLELPDDATVSKAQASGAVQLFVQHARAFKASFTLNPANAADVVAVCRRLDGLPLAIELAAARVRLLSPAALLARLDKALDIAATGTQGPSRQKTLRDTIAWSHDLLTAQQQVFFRRLGVFAGGADLDAVTAVTIDILQDADPLDLVADLVDASLATITEGVGGEPRVAMLETIRAYAHDQLHADGGSDDVGRRHAQHYLRVAQDLRTQQWAGGGGQLLQARHGFEVDHDNFREALGWALGSDGHATPDRTQVGLELCAELYASWYAGGYYAEARRWLDRAISVAGDQSNGQVAQCLTCLSRVLAMMGDYQRAQRVATQSVALCRRLGDTGRLSSALGGLARSQMQSGGNNQAARSSLEEAVNLAREIGDQAQLGRMVSGLALLEAVDHNFERSLELYTVSLRISEELGDDLGALTQRHNIACTLREMGRLQEAHQQMTQLIPQMLRLADPRLLNVLAEDYAAVLAETGHSELATRLLGSADARERNGTPRNAAQQAELEAPLAKLQASLPTQTWDREYDLGRNMTVEDALTEAHSASDKVPLSGCREEP